MITTTRVRCGQHGEPLTTRGRDLWCPREGTGCTGWRDLQPDPGQRVRVDDDGAVVLDVEDGRYGSLAFDVETTGGWCRALVREMADSSVLTITDGSGGLDFGDSGEVVVAIYSHADDWDDSGAEPVYAFTTPDLPTALDRVTRLYGEG
jgi:hypothetical protein